MKSEALSFAMGAPEAPLGPTIGLKIRPTWLTIPLSPKKALVTRSPTATGSIITERVTFAATACTSVGEGATPSPSGAPPLRALQAISRDLLRGPRRSPGAMRGAPVPCAGAPNEDPKGSMLKDEAKGPPSLLAAAVWGPLSPPMGPPTLKFSR